MATVRKIAAWTKRGRCIELTNDGYHYLITELGEATTFIIVNDADYSDSDAIADVAANEAKGMRRVK